MVSPQPRPFNTRSFVAVAMVTAGLALPFSGLMNHFLQFVVTPARHTWMTIHNSSSIMFLIFAIWHTALNWKPLLNHLRRARKQILIPRREAMLGFLLVVLLVGLAAAHTLIVPGADWGGAPSTSQAQEVPADALPVLPRVVLQ